MTYRFLLLIWLLAATLHASGQIFPVRVVGQSGPVANRVNIVFLSDGYQASEMTAFAADCQSFRQAFLNSEPFGSYAAYFNFFAIEVPSVDSGVSHAGTALDEPPGSATASLNTYFGVSMDCSGIHRLMCVGKTQALYSVLADNMPEYDLVVLLSNTGTYGGGGYPCAIVAGHNAFAAEIGIHEIGHAFGALADEYWVGSANASERANMTRNANPATIKWRNWLTAGAGIFDHQGDASWKKPANGTCKMEYLGRSFCAVCQETMVDRILSLVSPVDYTVPSVNEFLDLGEAATLRLGLVLPRERTLRIRWSVNGVPVGRQVDSLRITPAMLGYRDGSVEVAILDTTALSRSTFHLTTHERRFRWSVRVKAPCPVNATLRNGQWDDPSVWSCGHSPLTNETVRIGHIIDSTAFSAPGKLVFETGGTLRLGVVSKPVQALQEAVPPNKIVPPKLKVK